MTEINEKVNQRNTFPNMIEILSKGYIVCVSGDIVLSVRAAIKLTLPLNIVTITSCIHVYGLLHHYIGHLIVKVQICLPMQWCLHR